jgi:hypothetical protein
VTFSVPYPSAARVDRPASCSFKIAMICSSENRLLRMTFVSSIGRTLHQTGYPPRGRVTSHRVFVMSSGYEKSPDYGDPPRDKWEWFYWLALALIACGLVYLLTSG